MKYVSLIFLVLSCSALVYAFTVLLLSRVMKEKLHVLKRVEGISTKKESQYVIEKKKKEKAKSSPFLWLFKGKALEKLGEELAMAAIPLRAEEFMMIWIMVALLPASLVALFKFNIFVCTALVAAGLITPMALLQNARKKRMALLDKQLVDALTIIGNCLRAGFSFNQAMESIANEMPDPIAKEFTKALREIKLGLPMEKALLNMVDRLQNADLELIVSAVLIQRQVGGNLSEILDNIAETIKQRLMIKGQIRVLTSTGRTSGMVVGLLPLFLLGILMIINPDYVSTFFTTNIGKALLAVGAVMEVTGFLIVRKIVDVKF